MAIGGVRGSSAATGESHQENAWNEKPECSLEEERRDITPSRHEGGVYMTFRQY
jgi:hypothetical protein